MNGLFGFTSNWSFLHSAWIDALKRQFRFHRVAAEFVGRRITDRRTNSRRASERRVEDVTAHVVGDIQRVNEQDQSGAIAGTLKSPLDFVHFRGARLLTAKSAEAVTIKVDDDVVQWLSQQDSESQAQVNRLLRQQMHRARR